MPPKAKNKASASKPAQKKKANSSSDDEDGPSTSVSVTPPSKKVKTSTETFEQFTSRIEHQRKSAGSSILDFNFDKMRCRTMTKIQNLPKSHEGVLYWMSRDQRVQDNWAILYAQRLALKEKVPLFVCFCLVPKFLEATLRQYAFMLKGLNKVREELHTLKIPFHLLLGEAQNMIPEFVKKHKIGGVVTDFAPLRVPMAWTDQVSSKLPTDIPLCQVDAHNVIPLWVTSDKQEYAARTIRSKIDRNMAKYLTEFPPVIQHPHHSSIDFSKIPNPFTKWDDLIATLEIDKTIGEVDWAKPGTAEGFKTLKIFLDDKIKTFNSKRNDPNEDNLSNLSPWFHFGQISVARCILEVKKSSASEGAAAFIEEAVVRRELSDNFCFYNKEHYDSLEGASAWARDSLNEHRKDKREYVYNLESFEKAKTHDDLWNAAQNQMRIEGKMHGFLRMYWAKKILEWSESPEKALEIAIYLNDKYNLDGRDPNGYVGCMWSICGIHDMGWKERPIFGKIRFMNYQGCKRKFNVPAFEQKYKKLAREKGI